MQPRNLAARAGHWSATHRKAAILGWIAFVVATIALGGAIGTKHIDNNTGTGESARAVKTLDSSFPKRASEQVLVQSSTQTVADPQFKSTVNDLIAKLAMLPIVSDLRSPLSSGGAVSSDGHSALVQFKIDGSESQTKKKVAATLGTTAAARSS